MKECDETPPVHGAVYARLACPLTHLTFKDPMIDREGHTYERVAILKWLDSHTTSPMTRKNLRPTDLTPNRKVKELCAVVIDLLTTLEQSSAIVCKEDSEVFETWREVCPEGSQ